MRRPKTILIFGKTIPIEYVASFDDEHTEGMFSTHPFKITILDNDEWPSHLFHEATHAALDISGVAHALGENLEEAVVRAIENGLSTYFRPK